jgi:predicted dehydrogenase
MADRKLNAAVIGAGFIGRTHVENVRRLGNVHVVAVGAGSAETAGRAAAQLGIERGESDWRKILAIPGLDAVHICTPNANHAEVAAAALELGKHVMCEKPLTASVADAEKLVALARAGKLRNATCHNLRYYPMVQQMRRMREEGDLGDILIVQGGYNQDWLLYDTDWNWRIDAAAGGPLRAMADIGSHWFDMAEHITGHRVSTLSADLETFHPVRQKPVGAIETFAGKDGPKGKTVAVNVETEDFGAAIFRTDKGARGALTASQMSTGRKNRLSIEIYGTKGGVAWDQEQPDQLWIGRRNAYNQLLVKDPSLMKESARSYADLPGGHSEGYADTFKQIFRRFYDSILRPEASPEYPEFADGLRQMRILQAVLDSHRRRAWVDL